MKEKPISIEEYRKVGEEFFPKYRYVSDQLGHGSKAEDVLKVMESLAKQAMTKRKEDTPSIGFNQPT